MLIPLYGLLEGLTPFRSRATRATRATKFIISFVCICISVQIRKGEIIVQGRTWSEFVTTIIIKSMNRRTYGSTHRRS